MPIPIHVLHPGRGPAGEIAAQFLCGSHRRALGTSEIVRQDLVR